jgi:hypothetical protein
VITLLHEQRETQWPEATGTASETHCLAECDALWLDAAAIEAATGWTWEPEGLCHGDTCVPLPRPRGSGAEPLVHDGRLNLAAVWRHSGQPVVHDAARRTWVLGSGSAQRGAALASLQAPDFTLPDLQGVAHQLSACRGRKVFLATWASW